MNALALLAVALLVGFGGGWKVQAWRWSAADAERLQADAETQRLQSLAADAAAVRHEAEKAAIAAQRRVITKEVERVVYVESAVAAAVCLGPVGLRVIEAAATGRAVDPGQPTTTLPAAAAAR